MTLLLRCPQCKREYEPELQRPEDDARPIQEIFPDSTLMQREQLISGLCSDECYDEYVGRYKIRDYNYGRADDFLDCLEAIKDALEDKKSKEEPLRSNEDYDRRRQLREYFINLKKELVKFMRYREVACYVGSPYSVDENRVLLLVETIGRMIERIGIKAYVPHLHTQHPDKDVLSDDEVTRMDFEGVEASAFTIFEITNPSHGVGMEMYCSYINKIPYIALSKIDEGINVSKLIHGTVEKENLIYYDTNKKLFDGLFKSIILIFIKKCLNEIMSEYNGKIMIGEKI